MTQFSSRKYLVQVAKLYYVANMSQEEIATTMGISRSKVSRMLTLARDMRVVRFEICEYPDLGTELEEKIKNHFNLSMVQVVPSAPAPDDSKKNVGQAAAKYLLKNLKCNMRVGIEWGSTMEAMIDAYPGNPDMQGLEVVQITGGVHVSNSMKDGRELVKILAQKMGAHAALLQYPMVVRDRKLASLLMEKECEEHINKMRHLDVAFVGLGSSIPSESATHLGGYITLDESEHLVEQGTAADICGHRLTQDGDVAKTLLWGRTITIPAEDLRALPNVIGLATGENKRASIIAAARGGYLKGLIIDEVAAISLAGSQKLM